MCAQQTRDGLVLGEVTGQFHQGQNEQRDRDRDDRVDEGVEAIQVALAGRCGPLSAHGRRIFTGPQAPDHAAVKPGAL
jgi:hypothetical protein